MLSTQQLLKIEALVREVGSFQIEEQEKINSNHVIEKSLNQLVSYVDIESEKMLVHGLRSITPDAGFLTEEDTSTYHDEDLYWIIDPVDGTTNYLFGHRQFAISIALYSHQHPVYGNVFVPRDNEMFTATPLGAFLNQKPIHVSKRNQLSDSLIATGFPYYEFKELEAYIDVLKVLMKDTKGLRRMGSAAIDLVYTACGRFDAFFELNLSPWDVAAGAYIIQQAGGTVTDFKGGEDYVFGNSILAGNPPIKQEVEKVINRFSF